VTSFHKAQGTIMIIHQLFGRFRHLILAALLVAGIAACSSSDKRPLVVIETPLGVYGTSAATVQISVTLASGASTQNTVSVTADYTGKLGIYLPADSSGSGMVTVTVLDASSCPIATGVVAMTVTAGEITNVGAIALSPVTGGCGSSADSGVVDAGTPGTVDGGVGQDGAGIDGASGSDAQPTGLDGPLVAIDTQPTHLDAAVADLPVVPDAPIADAPADLPVADAYVAPDLGPDSSPDAPPTTMQLFARCRSYTHSKLTSTGEPGDWVVRGVMFTPDGRHLVSLGDDGRGKVWDVSAAGLAVNASGLEFAGSGRMNGVFTVDGKQLAIGSQDGIVKIYDFQASLDSGAAVSVGELSPDLLPVTSKNAFPRGFTTDGKHLVVVYEAYYFGDANQIAVWDLSTQQLVRSFESTNADDWPMNFLPAAFTSALWVVSGEPFTGDGGGYQTLVTLMDVSQAAPTKAQFIANGYVNRAVFSPDGSTLALALDTGEVSLWDITNKAVITQLGSPLVVGSSSGGAEGIALAYSPDGKYVAAGFGGFSTPSARLISLQPKQTLQKTLDYDPFSMAFSPDGLGLAIGEYYYGTILLCTP
jgi:WD40 repeat protein